MGRWICGRWICVWGAPGVCPKSLRNLQNKGFGGSLDLTSGRPKNADSTTTDPTSHSRPSGPPKKETQTLGPEIWEGDERRKFQSLESGDSLNGRKLFSEFPFL